MHAKTTARFAGLFSLLTVLGGVFAQGYIARNLIDFSDASATAINILEHPDRLRLGFAVFMVEMACDIAKTALFFELFRPVNRGISLIAAFLGLTGSVIKAMSRVFFLAPLLVLSGAPYLGVFSPAQLESLSLLFLSINDRGAGTAVIFYGFSTPLTGYLMLRSTFLPRFLGVLEIVCGVGWMTFLYQPLYQRLFPLIVGLALFGVTVLNCWLLGFGVNAERWREQAAASSRV